MLAKQTFGLACSLVARHLPQDWRREHGTQPVLLEAYVDPQQQQGTCYQASSWQNLGLTKGSPASGAQPARTPKHVWVRPLHPEFREILCQGPPQAVRQGRQSAQADPNFVQLWQGLLDTLTRIANDYDRQWVRRRRTLNTLLVVLFVVRIVFQPDNRGYATVLQELWDHCRDLNLPLPSWPVTPAAICRARAKVSEDVFLRIHRELLAACPPETPHSLGCGTPHLRRRWLQAQLAAAPGRSQLSGPGTDRLLSCRLHKEAQQRAEGPKVLISLS